MALQIWLPLTKDLRNQGLSNTTVTNSGATYSNTGGKLGGCYSFDGTDDAIGVGNLSTMVDTEFSWSCWFYRSEWSSKSWETIFGGPSGFELETKNSSTNSPLMYAYSWGKGTFTYELNQWNHLVMTRTTSETKFYLNGELKLTGSAGSIPSGNYFVGSWSSTTGQNFKGKVNDVRIYNHCLSQMEVKQLSQGLVLHYPLNRQGWGQENMLTNSSGYSGTTDYAGLVTVGNENGKPYLIAKRTDTTSTSRTFCSHSAITSFINSWSAGSKFTISGYYKIPSTETYAVSANMFIRWNDGGEKDTGFSVPTSTIKDKWIRFEHTFTVPSYEAGGISFCLSAFSKGLATIYWKDIKLEYGEKATPWCPNSTDALATTMGLNGTTEYDCSGFCNNGTRTGTFNWISDTPKYQVSTSFNGSNYIGLTPPDSEIQTVAFWVKWSSIPSTQTIGFIDEGSGLAFGLSYGNIIVSCQVAGAASCYNASVLSANNWYHIVVVKTGATTRKLYINAVEQTANSTTNYWSHINNELQIGKRKNTGEGITGWMSDFRMYATALSADDVKSLYQNCATIDADGTIHGQIRS